MSQKYLDSNGVQYLWSKIAEDYSKNGTLMAIIQAIDETKQDSLTGTPGQFLVIGNDGKPVAQTILMNAYYKGTTEPDNSFGNDGDLYLVKE